MRARGFTLIELMIGMALLAVLSIGMITSVTVVGRVQRSTSSIDVAQAGARAGLELIVRDVEMAAAGAKSGTVNFGNGTAQVLAIRVTDSATGPDRLDLITVDPNAQATLLAAYTAGQTTLTLSSTTGFAVGDLVQVSDLNVAQVVQVASITTNNGSPAITITANANAQPQTFPAGSYVFRSRAVAYYVDTTAFGAQNPLLMIDPDGPGAQAGQPLAEGIEDFQVSLGFDTNSNGVLSNVGAAVGDDEWTFNVGGEAAPATLTQLRAVRVTLVGRTVQNQAGTRGSRPGAEDHAGSGTTDGFSRRVLRTEITVRNFNL